VRRVVLFGLLLALVGMSTAFAASLSVQTEDIATFTTDVSISVPTSTTSTTMPPPAPFPATIYVRGAADTGVGSLDFVAPAKNDSVTRRLLVLSTEPIELQTTPSMYLTWKSQIAPAQGYLLSGSVTLYIEQNGGAANRVTAGLFICPSTVPDSTTVTLPDLTTVPPPATCTVVDVASAAPGTNGEGYQERRVSFGAVGPVVIPPGQQLRLKVVNRANDGQVLSTEDVDLQWGFLPSRQSRLEITTP
jgi:hypothetical protein